MNAPQNETRPESFNLHDEQVGNILNGLVKNAVPVGTFAGPQDFVLRFHDGELVAMNSGGQGGGQN